jgi:predicted transposase YbfD/YdcC
MNSIHIFENIPDPRAEKNPNKLYTVAQIVFQTIAAVASGCEHWTEIEDFGEDKKEWIEKYIEVGETMPSHDTLSDFFKRLKGDVFTRIFIEWTRGICQLTDGEVVAIDGKTMRRSHQRSVGKEAIHLISAWASSNKIVLAQQAVDSKSNEITAIPALLRLLELKGALVSIDAMGCQHEIARQIVDAGANYLLAVKGNQGQLLEGVQDCFKLQQVTSTKTTVEKQHGRIETRTCCVITKPTEILEIEKWPQLTSVIRIHSKREILAAEKITEETRYYICSKTLSASEALDSIRSHWSIENNLHWILDVAFREDESRMSSGDSDQNFALIRKIVVNLLAIDKSIKMSVQRKRLKAARNDTFREKLLRI